MMVENELAWRWHDNLIYGLAFDIGDATRQEWWSDLLFDIDFIEEWACPPVGEHSFRVAAATLAFHNAGDLSISVEHGDSGGRNALNEWAIHSVSRKRLDLPFEHWRWEINLNMPAGGRIAFCSSGFTQTLRTEPRWVPEQRLPSRDRPPMALG